MSTISHEQPSLSLFGRTRTALLALLFGHSDESFHLRQLVREIGAGHGALQRELRLLTEMGLIVRTVRGNQVLYQANPRSPIFSELRSLIAKTSGVHEQIRSALATLGTNVRVAFIYGSVARQREQANSDVDLMVLGDATFGEVVSALGPAQKAIRREINPTVYSIAEFRAKLAAGNHFLKSVVGGKNLFVIGSRNELAKLAAK
jgi:predicted nucleotidyltransferase